MVISVNDFVRKCLIVFLYEPNIQARKLFRWNNLTYSYFRSNRSRKSLAPRESISYVTGHKKDLPQFMLHPLTLLICPQNIFKGWSYCLTPFEEAPPSMNLESFCELLKTAATNIDVYNQLTTTKRYSSTTYTVNQHEQKTKLPNLAAAKFVKI